VTGSRREAESGQLQFLVGGDAATYRACVPLFEAMGKRHLHLGPSGSGSCAKLANNLMGAIHMAALSEAMHLVRAYGIDPVRFLDVITHSGARSAVVEGKGARLIQEDFRPDFALALMAKDLRLATELAGSLGQRLPVLTAAKDVYGRAAQSDAGSLDMCAIFRWYSEPAGARAGPEAALPETLAP
jgi:3-hydroxyisobutyrate dehydrogenase